MGQASSRVARRVMTATLVGSIGVDKCSHVAARPPALITRQLYFPAGSHGAYRAPAQSFLFAHVCAGTDESACNRSGHAITDADQPTKLARRQTLVRETAERGGMQSSQPTALESWQGVVIPAVCRSGSRCVGAATKYGRRPAFGTARPEVNACGRLFEFGRTVRRELSGGTNARSRRSS